ncbi:MOSC domain-containing protein [Ferrimonas marina]|uniref:MOSC domain-containing protein n=1 Tax=Ferrimonas marina TaxID=299255 RepID=A0A1M5YTA3_9GAMM|nr:MOSC domain-containing protein [Ferrimonas marina]SHI15245.1 hypothetical protein SAMN02745129_4409 [Ferrimonas marina]
MIKAIFTAPKRRAPQQQHTEVTLHADRGIVGDRNYDRQQYPGQNITFVESEEIAAFNQRFGQSIPWHATRRNVITQGVRLNALEGQRFAIGDVLFEGVELCEPCKLLGDDLAGDGLSSAEVVKAFVSRGGLRARILNDGEIREGMSVARLPEQVSDR